MFSGVVCFQLNFLHMSYPMMPETVSRIFAAKGEFVAVEIQVWNPYLRLKGRVWKGGWEKQLRALHLDPLTGEILYRDYLSDMSHWEQCSHEEYQNLIGQVLDCPWACDYFSEDEDYDNTMALNLACMSTGYCSFVGSRDLELNYVFKSASGYFVATAKGSIHKLPTWQHVVPQSCSRQEAMIGLRDCNAVRPRPWEYRYYSDDRTVHAFKEHHPVDDEPRELAGVYETGVSSTGWGAQRHTGYVHASSYWKAQIYVLRHYRA